MQLPEKVPQAQVLLGEVICENTVAGVGKGSVADQVANQVAIELEMVIPADAVPRPGAVVVEAAGAEATDAAVVCPLVLDLLTARTVVAGRNGPPQEVQVGPNRDRIWVLGDRTTV